MKHNLAKLFAVSTFVAGGSLVITTPANAIQITLEDGDFINVGTYGALFTGEEAVIPQGTFNSDGAVITKVEFDNDPGFGFDFVPGGSFATADLNSTNIDEILGAYTTNIGVASIRSFDITQSILDGDFTPTAPLDFDFSDGSINNSFAVAPGFDFITLDDPAAGNSFIPDLTFQLTSFSTVQTASLLDGDADIGVGFEGEGIFITSDGANAGTGSFSTTFPSDGDNDAIGTGVVSAEVEAVPESSTVGALIGFGLLGSALAFKKKSKVA